MTMRLIQITKVIKIVKVTKKEERVCSVDDYEDWGGIPEFAIMENKEKDATLIKDNEEPNKDCTRFRDSQDNEEPNKDCTRVRDRPGLHVPKRLEFHSEFATNEQMTEEEAIGERTRTRI